MTKPILLIIDDDATARQTVEMLLWREGYEMLFAGSGAEALQLLGEREPDVILLDVMMPGMDGFELCRRLKGNERWQHIPIIMVTALDSKADLARGLDAGADDFVHKPVNGLELRARVRSMLRIKQRHDELEASLQLREDLANMVMHDVRTPLTSIMVLCDLLEGEVSSAQGREDLGVLRGQAERLGSFITDMLLMTRMDQGRLVLNCSPVDVNELLMAVVESFRPLAASRNVQLVAALPAESRCLSLDGKLWQRVVDNLLSNALKFSPENGRVTLEASYASPVDGNGHTPHFRLRVLDEGPGIPEGHWETIFDKYQIVASKRRDVTQVGLGLAFCKMVVEAHGGRISAGANEPRGAAFTVEL